MKNAANNIKKAEIDVSENRIYVVKDGRVVPVDPPTSGYGEQTAIWKDGKVIDVIDTKRIRI